MLWIIRAALFTGYGAASLLLVLAAADYGVKRWKRAVGETIAGLAGLGAGVVMIAAGSSVFAASVIESGAAPPSDQARIMATTISTGMTAAIVGFGAGVLLGAYLAARRRKIETAG